MRLEGFVEKGWGSELIWVTNDQYCSKFLRFNSGSQFSMHFHRDKKESWYVLDGLFEVTWIETKDASVHTKSLRRYAERKHLLSGLWRLQVYLSFLVACFVSHYVDKFEVKSTI